MLLGHVEPTMMAAFLYLGAGLGMFVYSLVSKATGKATPTEPLTKKELPYTIAMVVLDIIAPILLMFGIKSSNAANVSLINHFEIVATDTVHSHEHTHTHTHIHVHGEDSDNHEHNHNAMPHEHLHFA